jgi:hypothetical protein
MIKHLYYHVSWPKDLEMKDKEQVLSDCQYYAQREASRRMKKARTGWWTTKHIGQTPRRHSFRIRFSYRVELNSP